VTDELRGIHHVAVICSSYDVSKRFYTEWLGLRIVAEHYRADCESFKLDLALRDGSRIELFSFPSPPSRLSYPEACGARHLAFAVDDDLREPGAQRAHSVEILVERRRRSGGARGDRTGGP
jgi:catechol 2,3-dioxygenase-like lactoylglutathione lyase family enzyme